MNETCKADALVIRAILLEERRQEIQRLQKYHQKIAGLLDEKNLNPEQRKQLTWHLEFVITRLGD